MKGSLPPRIIIVEPDGVTSIRRPKLSMQCSGPCTPATPEPCERCCYERAKDLLLAIYRPELVTAGEEAEARHHEYN